MKITKTMKPGKKGTQRFVREWGENLVAVRYREEPKKKKVFTTIEIIVDERDKSPTPVNRHKQLAIERKKVVAVSVKYQETELRHRLKERGARWSQQLKLWLVQYEHVVALGITDKVTLGAAEKCLDVDTSIIEMGA